LLLSPPLESRKPVPNEEIIDLCMRSNDKLFPILTLEPTLKGITESIELAKKNKGFAKGFKILLGYFPIFPTDRIFSPLYDYAESENLPVMFHTGDTATSDGSLEHSHPMNLDPLANERPELKMVVCHFGNPWISDAAELLYKHPNVHADISGLFVGGAKYSGKYLDYLSRSLSDAIYFIGSSDKVIFGTDYPIESYVDALDLVRKLKIDESDIDRILGKNAQFVFSI
jgi:uncharacterized protein